MGVGGPLKRRIGYVFKKTVWFVLKKTDWIRLKKDGLGTSLQRRIGRFEKNGFLAACEELSYDSIGVVTTVGSTVRHVIT
jgi:hypothetical protein